jgi:DNA polymerase-4
MNDLAADHPVQWLFLDLNAFFASCEQQEDPALRGKPVIVVQTPTDSACAIARATRRRRSASKPAPSCARRGGFAPRSIPVQANHRLYTDYHGRILTAVDSCLPIEKVMSIDEVACRLMGTERQVAAARELALKDQTSFARAGRRVPHLLDRPRAAGSTRAIAFCPPSVTQGAPSGPTITP